MSTITGGSAKSVDLSHLERLTEVGVEVKISRGPTWKLVALIEVEFRGGGQDLESSPVNSC